MGRSSSSHTSGSSSFSASSPSSRSRSFSSLSASSSSSSESSRRSKRKRGEKDRRRDRDDKSRDRRRDRSRDEKKVATCDKNRSKEKKRDDSHKRGDDKKKDAKDRREKRGGDSGAKKRDRSRDKDGRPEMARSNGRTFPVRPPFGTHCQACKRPNHWTIDCEAVLEDPSRFPHINVRDGCPICGKVGHKYSACDQIKYPCGSCGDLHLTKGICPYEYDPVTYHEFFDEGKGYPYYFCSKTREISWVYKGNTLDSLLWHCDRCKVLIPDSVKECVLCHEKRRRHRRSGPAGAADEKKREPADGLSFSAISGWIDETASTSVGVEAALAAAAAVISDGNSGGLDGVAPQQPPRLDAAALAMLE